MLLLGCDPATTGVLSCLGAYARTPLRFPVRQRLSRTLAPLLQLRRRRSARADSKPCSGPLTTRSACPLLALGLDALTADRFAVSGFQRGAPLAVRAAPQLRAARQAGYPSAAPTALVGPRTVAAPALGRGVTPLADRRERHAEASQVA